MIRRRRTWDGLFLSLGLLIGGQAAAGTPTDDERKASYDIGPKAQEFIAPVARADWLKDDVFVAKLKELAASDLPAGDKADAFAQMQAKLGWLFLGVTKLFPGQGYAQTYAGIATTFFRYQEKMPADLDIASLLELARKGRGDHPFRASNAVLLAVVLNHRAAKDAVVRAIDGPAIESAPVPAIDLHNLALAATLTRDPRVVAKLFGLLPHLDSSESREDVIVATSIYRDVALRDRIESFVKAEFPARFDNAVRSALLLLARHGPPDHFRAFYKELGDLPDVGRTDVLKLSKFWDDGFRDALQLEAREGKVVTKVWDGFEVKPLDDGMVVRFGDSFRAFVPNESPEGP
jgi:hypothetical protein